MAKENKLRISSKCHGCGKTSGSRKTFEVYKVDGSLYPFCRRGCKNKYVEKQKTGKE